MLSNKSNDCNYIEKNLFLGRFKEPISIFMFIHVKISLANLNKQYSLCNLYVFLGDVCGKFNRTVENNEGGGLGKIFILQVEVSILFFLKSLLDRVGNDTKIPKLPRSRFSPILERLKKNRKFNQGSISSGSDYKHYLHKVA